MQFGMHLQIAYYHPIAYNESAETPTTLKS